MTLHLEQLLADIQAMNEQATSTERQAWLEAARRLMRAYDPDRLGYDPYPNDPFRDR